MVNWRRPKHLQFALVRLFQKLIQKNFLTQVSGTPKKVWGKVGQLTGKFKPTTLDSIFESQSLNDFFACSSQDVNYTAPIALNSPFPQLLQANSHRFRNSRFSSCWITSKTRQLVLTGYLRGFFALEPPCLQSPSHTFLTFS